MVLNGFEYKVYSNTIGFFQTLMIQILLNSLTLSLPLSMDKTKEMEMGRMCRVLC